MKQRAWGFPLAVACLILTALGCINISAGGNPYYDSATRSILINASWILYAWAILTLGILAVRVSIHRGNFWKVHLDALSASFLIICGPAFAWMAMGGDEIFLLNSIPFVVTIGLIGLFMLSWPGGPSFVFHCFYLPLSLLVPFAAISAGTLSLSSLVVNGVPFPGTLLTIGLVSLALTALLAWRIRWAPWLGVLLKNISAEPGTSRLKALARLSILTVAIVAGTLATCLAVRQVWTIRISLLEARMRAAGQPVRLGELKTERFTAADAYPALINAMEQFEDTNYLTFLLSKGHILTWILPWDKKMARTVSLLVNALKPHVDYYGAEIAPVIQSASVFRPSRHDGDFTFYVSTMTTLRMIRILGYQKAMSGDPGGAWKYIRQMIKLADLIDTMKAPYPYFISRWAITAASGAAVQIAIKSTVGGFPADIEAGFKRWIIRNPEGKYADYLSALALERRLRDRTGWIWQPVRWDPDYGSLAKAQTGMSFLNWIGFLDASAYETVTAIRSSIHKDKDNGDWLSPYYDEAKWFPTPSRINSIRAQLRLVLAANALQTYRRTHDRYPAKLDQLCPKHLARDEIKDPFGDQDLNYISEPKGSGYLLSSRGHDGKMNDGNNTILKIENGPKIEILPVTWTENLIQAQAELDSAFAKVSKGLPILAVGLPSRADPAGRFTPGALFAGGVKSGNGFTVWGGAKFEWRGGKGIFRYSSTGSEGSGVTLSAPGNRPFYATGSKCIVLKMRVPPDLKILVKLNENQYSKEIKFRRIVPDADGADGEQSVSRLIRGSGRLENHRVRVAILRDSGNGNQEGNKRNNMAAISAIEIEVPGLQDTGTIEIDSIKFE